MPQIVVSGIAVKFRIFDTEGLTTNGQAPLSPNHWTSTMTQKEGERYLCKK